MLNTAGKCLNIVTGFLPRICLEFSLYSSTFGSFFSIHQFLVLWHKTPKRELRLPSHRVLSYRGHSCSLHHYCFAVILHCNIWPIGRDLSSFLRLFSALQCNSGPRFCILFAASAVRFVLASRICIILHPLLLCVSDIMQHASNHQIPVPLFLFQLDRMTNLIEQENAWSCQTNNKTSPTVCFCA